MTLHLKKKKRKASQIFCCLNTKLQIIITTPNTKLFLIMWKNDVQNPL